MRIAVIGPLPPYRSGVARHTAALADALTNYGEVSRWSFSRQYPRFLYPGETDRDDHAPWIEGVEYVLDTINPLTWGAAADAILAREHDIAVIPAWTFFTAPALAALTSRLKREGVRVVTVAHNAADHENAAWKRWLLRQQIMRADAAVTHNQALAEAIGEMAPNLPIEISPHPLFDYPAPTSPLPRRAQLELLMFGLVRPYKGADLLIDAMARCHDVEVRLSIVGEAWGGSEALREQINARGLADRIELVDRYVSDEEAASYFVRADIVVLPYRSVTGSGVVPVAWHFGKPVITTDLPGFRSIITDGANGWLTPPEDVDALAGVIRERARRSDAQTLALGIEHTKSKLSWTAFAEAVLRVVNPAPREKTSSYCGANPPKVSIVMPVHNGATFLAEALDSITVQQFADFEVLVVDDGSTDETPKILERYCEHDRRFRRLTNETNIGVPGSTNIGLAQARGEYIARLDADDYMLPQRLRLQTEFLDRSPDYVLVGAGYDIIDAQGHRQSTEDCGADDKETAWRALFQMPVLHSSMMFRRAAMMVGDIKFDAAYDGAADYDFTQRLLRRGKGCVLPGALLSYRIHSQNVSVLKRTKQRASAMAASLREVRYYFPDLDSDKIEALLHFIYGEDAAAADLGLALAGMCEIEQSFSRLLELSGADRSRIRALAARCLCKAALSAGIAKEPAKFAQFLWLAKEYLPYAPGESLGYLRRRASRSVTMPKSVGSAAKC